MEQETKKINRSIKIISVVCIIYRRFDILRTNRHIISNIGKRIKCKSNNSNDNGCINNMHSVSKSNIINCKKDRKCKFIKTRSNYVVDCIISINIWKIVYCNVII